MFKQKIIVVCLCNLFFGACVYNAASTWVEPLDRELQLNELTGQKESISPKKQKNFLREKQILLLKVFSEKEVDKKITEVLDQQIKDSLAKSTILKITYEADFEPQKREDFQNQNKLFLEDFYFSFRVNKDLVESISQIKYGELLLLPQILFWACKTCAENNLIFLRISLVDIKNKELVWFANNYYRFSDPPSKEQLTKKVVLLWEQILVKFYRDFKE